MIKFYTHCIKMSKISDEYGFTASNIREAYSDPNQRHTTDLLIAFVHHLDGKYSTHSDYALHLGESAVIINKEAMLDTYEIAHAVGHVLGAGHTKDPEEPGYKPIG